MEQLNISLNRKLFLLWLENMPKLNKVCVWELPFPPKENFTLRADKPKETSTLYISAKEKIIFKKKLQWVNPANMIEFYIDISPDVLLSSQNLEVKIDD